MIVAALVCTLLSGGVMAYPTVGTVGYRLYIQNPSSFPQDASSVEVVVRAPDKPEFHVVLVDLQSVTVPARTQVSIDLGPRPDITDDPTLVAGSHIDCK